VRITRLDARLLRIPTARTIPLVGDAGRPASLAVLLVRLETDDGPAGVGLSYTFGAGGRALLALATDDLAPLLVGEDPLNHERVIAKVRRQLSGLGLVGVAAAASTAVDLALWDLKGRAAGLPLFRLLGGARESAPAFTSEGTGPDQSTAQTMKALRPALDQGLMGALVRVSGDPERDAERLREVRAALGEDAWLGVDAAGRYDVATALVLGRFLQHELDIDWFEQPVPADDLAGLRRLAAKLDVPVAAGATFDSVEQFRLALERRAVGVLRPDPVRLGGLTPTLKVIALAEAYHCPVAPVRLPEVAVHLACGLPGVQAVESVPWLSGLFSEPPAVEQGRLVPPARPGLGLELDPKAVKRYEAKG
jgi:L-alanine-DL-glutamate epimerase-like enolase superfamily enzyme